MNKDGIRALLTEVLTDMGVEDPQINLERPRDPSHGDVATNVAMTLASALRRPPRAIAEEIVERIGTDVPGVDGVEIAGPGFLNFRLSADSVAGAIPQILRAGDGYGRSDVGEGRPQMVEFVSANPTGPLHLGHGRQAALGDGIASLLDWCGWSVHREYYYNDAGVQIERLARSVWIRYQQALGADVELPEDAYHGDYVADIAATVRKEYGDQFAGEETAEALDAMRIVAVREMRANQDTDLHDFRVYFDEYFLESSLYSDRAVEETVAALRETGLVYERDGATWLRTTEYGDDKDRVMIKSDGSATYFLPDVAYHRNKWNRGFHHVINVQGSDHHGTVARVRAGLQALGLPAGYPEYVLHQMVRVERDGQEVKFSKRAGSYTTIRDLMDEVGVDVTRYFLQMRKPEGHLVFDLDMALDQSEKNPVYKVQYAHARMCSIFRKAGEDINTWAGEAADVALLTHDQELELVKQLAEFPQVVERAATARATHLMCDYLEQTAGAVNSWYHAGNPTRNPELAVLAQDPALREARLALTQAVRIVLRNGLSILGIDAPYEMIRDPDADDGVAGAPGSPPSTSDSDD
jgi:arginyl-tRNA synthetase